MTTEYRDKTGKLLRTDGGTKPRSSADQVATPAAAAPVTTTAPASTTADATASASKEK